METFDSKTLAKNLKIDAKAVGIPSGAAEIFTEKSLKSKKIITEKDLERAIAKELKKYNADFAYVYENRDKII